MADHEKEVHSASRGGRTDVVKRLLEDHPGELDLNSTHESGVWTALHEACDFGNFEIYRMLSEYPGIDMNKQDKDGRTGLYWASYRSRTQIVADMLKDERVKINRPNYSNETPLYKVCENQQVEVVQTYLACGRRVDVDVKTNQNHGRPNTVAGQGIEHQELTALLNKYREDPFKTRDELRAILGYPKTLLETYLGVTLSVSSKFSPPEATDAANLTLVSVADSQLTSVPEKIGTLSYLLELSLRDNPIVTLPDNLANLTLLSNLNLRNTGLKEFPQVVGKLTNLTVLSLRSNELSSLPDSFKSLKNLKELDISKNLFPAIPDPISELLVTTLNASFNQITTTPAWIVQSKITSLDLSHNRLNLAACVPHLGNITSLKISHCELIELPAEFCGLSKLTTLDASQNNIALLPDSFANMTNLVNLNLRGESLYVGYLVQGRKQLSPDVAKVIANLLMKSKNLKKLNILNCKILAEGSLHIAQALVWNFEHNNTSIQKLDIDDISFESEEGLDIIPLDIRQKGVDDVARFMLDLYRSPKAPPVYRSKLMVVGYESVGKTTVLDCIFYQSGTLIIKQKYMVLFKKLIPYWFELQGRELRQYTSKSKSKLVQAVVLENRKWQLEEIYIPATKAEKGIVGFTLRKVSGENSGLTLELRCPDDGSKKDWVSRLKREVMNAATHGIEVTNQVIDHPLAHKQITDGRLELSVWDFAGQHDYYNNHHYFLQARTVFLVLWKMSEGEAGLKSLEFWFRSLAVHLPRDQNDPSGKPLFSILVVGTFLDRMPAEQQDQAQQALRQRRIKMIAQEAGLSCVVESHEVSCWNMTNIDKLRDSIVTNILSHSYMGERVPLTYLMIEKAVRQLRQPFRQEVVLQEATAPGTQPKVSAPPAEAGPSSSEANLPAAADAPATTEGQTLIPIVDIARVMEIARERTQEEDLPRVDKERMTFDENLTKRALKLLFAWGECVYFDYKDGRVLTVNHWEEEDPTKEGLKGTERQRIQDEEDRLRREREEEVASIVVLDPTFLTKDILANLFKPALMSHYKDGVIEHEALAFIWPRYYERASALLSLMEKFEVCFRLRDKEPRPFKEQRSIISSLLPEAPPADLAAVWPAVRPSILKGENTRVIAFNVVPKEMVSRLMVRLHKLINNQKIWRYGIFLISKQTQALVEVKITSMEEEAGVDLSAPTKAEKGKDKDKDKDRDKDPAKLKRRDKFKPSGQIVVTVRGTNPHLQKELMETIVEIIAVTAEGYPGMTMHQFVRSPNDPQTLINLAEIIADSQRPEGERSLVCPKVLTPLNAEELLVATGLLVKEAPKDAVVTGVPISQDFRQVVREELTLAQRNLMHNAQQIIKHSYPSAFLLLPLSPEASFQPSSLMGALSYVKSRAEGLVFDKSQLHCLCELHVRDQDGRMQACWHPTAKEGVELRELNETMKKVGPALKATSVILQVVGVSVRLAGIPFPNLGEVTDLLTTYVSKADNVLREVKGVYDGLQADSDEQVLGKIKDAGPGQLRPKAMEGDSLLAVKVLFGEVAGGYLTKAGLRQCFVLYDGPLGNAGDVYWLCEEHSKLVDLQNTQKTNEIRDLINKDFAGFWKA